MHIIKKILIPAAIILVFFLLPAKPAQCSEIQQFNPMDKSIFAEKAFFSVTASFAAMTDYLSANNYKDGYYTLKERKDRKEVFEFLQQNGFDASLAFRIISSYLLWDSDSAEALLIPAGSLPTLQLKDRPKTEYYFLNSNYVIFRLHFYDCYQIGDQYSLFIAANRDEEEWFISEWQLFEAVSN